jgi:hypothetical protein
MIRNARLLQRYRDASTVSNMWLEISERNRCGHRDYNSVLMNPDEVSRF